MSNILDTVNSSLNIEGLWEIDRIINNPYTQIKIHFNDGHLPRAEPLIGFMIDDTFNLTGSANFGSNLGEVLQSLTSDIPGMDKFQGAVEKAGEAASMLGGGKKLTVATIKCWDGSEPPPISFSILFVATKPEDKPEANAAELITRCYPKFDDNLGQLMFAPMGYVPINAIEHTNLASIPGTCTVSIGRWFHAIGLLLESAEFQNSKECIESGSPLYSTGTVSFSPYKEISYEEYRSFFRLI